MSKSQSQKKLKMTNTKYFLSSILILSICDTVIYSDAAAASDKDDTLNKTQEQEKFDIVYGEKFKELKPDTLQVVGNDNDDTLLVCHSKTRDRNLVNWLWLYHGIEEHVAELEIHQDLVWVGVEGPPVVRMECVDGDNASISNSTLLYKGDGKPPFLYKTGETLSINLLNKTTARLPCLLNYPLDILGDVELQLFKDGAQLENTNNSYTYIPEYGYILNLTKLEQPFGNYECKVINLVENSTSYNEDFVKIEFTKDDQIRAEITVKPENSTRTRKYYTGDPNLQAFLCKVPKSNFENKFEWFFLLNNGSYTTFELEPQNGDKYTITHVPDSFHYSDLVGVKFSSTNITHVVCRAYTKNNEKSYNNTYAVVIREPMKPKIQNLRSSTDPIFYTAEKNLTCLSDGDPVAFTWLKNGKPVEARYIKNSVLRRKESRSVITLEPFEDEVDRNYTCEAKNFLGNSTVSYRVQAKPGAVTDRSKMSDTMVVLSSCLAALTVIMLLIFTFFQVKLKRRKFSDEKITRFFHAKESDSGDELQEPFESVSYDPTKEININSLSFVRLLKVGNFGKVQFGNYLDMNKGYRVPVAIKSIKDNPAASQEDVEFAFDNFLKEIKIMQILGEHANVVKYVGAVTANLSRYSAYIVLEYCSEGDLCTYLRTLQRRGVSFYDDIQGLSGSGSGGSVGSLNGIELKTSHLMKWSEDIASGLEYIASKKLVHRDIAARNVLLAYEGVECNHPDPGTLTAKISDFGLSKDLKDFPRDYYPIINRNQNIALPLRWMSVETLETLKFSTQSDAWAFGVTLWELFTLGESPYSEIEDSEFLFHVLSNHLKQGNILPEPQFAPRQIWEIMSSCWNESPTERPNFDTLRELLRAINENLENQVIQQDPVNVYSTVQLMDSGYSTVNSIQNMGYENDEDSESQDEFETEDSFV